jgi:hypothetical protein
MIRDPLADKVFWERRTEYSFQSIKKDWEVIREPSKNPMYDPQFTLDTAKDTLKLLLRRYSRGDSISELSQHFTGLLDAWELSNKLAIEINQELGPGESWDHRHLVGVWKTKDSRGHTDPRAWIFELSNLNHYNWCFWLVGLALSLEVPDDQWQRLLVLIDVEGEDILLDRVIASRQPKRKIGTKLLHKKPYIRLLKVIDAPQEQQAALLREFVENWYTELARSKGNNEPWWHFYCDLEKYPLKCGYYFGCWCIEAIAAVKVFDLDDSLCLGHKHYPGDLLRPNEPTTHPIHKEKSLLRRLFGK